MHLFTTTSGPVGAGAARRHLGDSYASDEPERAEALYRCLIAKNPTMAGTTLMQQVKLAEVLIDRGGDDALEEAGQLLRQWVEMDSSRFPDQLFRWKLAVVAVSESTGHAEVARQAARRALQHAEQGSVFPRHRGVGVVQTDKATLHRLRVLAAGKSRRLLPRLIRRHGEKP